MPVGNIVDIALEKRTRTLMETQKKAAGPSGTPSKKQPTQRQLDAATRARLKASKSKKKSTKSTQKTRTIQAKKNAKGEYTFSFKR